MRLHRLIALLLLMETRGHVKAREMAVALETSERTIYRDIETLCQAGIPIAATTGPLGGFRLMDGYTVRMKDLNCDDVVSLFFGGIGLRWDEQGEAALRLKTALAKLEQALPETYRDDVRIARERFFFEPTDWWEEHAISPLMQVIRRAVWRSNKLRLTYSKPGKRSSLRVVHPYGLVLKNNQWYLTAYCEDSQGLRVFKCERIVDVEALEETFLIPNDFSLEVFWRANSQEFKMVCSERDFYPVKLRIPPNAVVDVSVLAQGGKVISEFKGPTGQLQEIEVNWTSWELAKKNALATMTWAEIISPQELRDHLLATISEAALVYRIYGSRQHK